MYVCMYVCMYMHIHKELYKDRSSALFLRSRKAELEALGQASKRRPTACTSQQSRNALGLKGGF